MVPGIGTPTPTLVQGDTVEKLTGVLISTPFPFLPNSLPLFRSLPPQERITPHLDRSSKQRRRHLPVVLLGLLPCLLLNSDEWLHWQPTQLWHATRACRPQSWLSAYPRTPVRLLSDGVRVCHRGNSRRCAGGTGPGSACTRLQLRVDDACVLSTGVLGVVSERVGFQVGSARLRRSVVLRFFSMQNVRSDLPQVVDPSRLAAVSEAWRTLWS